MIDGKSKDAIKRFIVSKERASSCYFRSAVKLPYRKAMLQITEKCNLHCAHCFLDSDDRGEVVEFEDILKKVLFAFKSCRVASVTLTGGEPFLHPLIIEIIKILRKANIKVGISSNATAVTEQQMKILSQIGGVHVKLV
jgi:MoaA/NifB/PqqE/SkfB family radical SAM enzyme